MSTTDTAAAPASTITLAEIEAAQAHTAQLLEQFKAQATKATPIALWLPGTTLHIYPGERYAGLVLDADGKPSHHLILLPGEGTSKNWDQAQAWAAEAGGELPTRQEQALLYANLKAEFQSAWYWSSEAYGDSSAWIQGFNFGDQNCYDKSYACRCRAVRRFAA